MASNDEAVEKLASICGVEIEVAKNLLEACGGNLEMAVDMHMEDNGGGGGGGGASAGVAGEDEVRAPIPQRQEVMVEPGFEGYVMNNRVNKSHSQRRVRSVFDGFRDFQAEARTMEDRLDAGLPVSKSKKKTLEELFKPPLDLLYQGDWQSAREHASSSGRWLLVNIQNPQEFQCQVLNRDLWSNPGVKMIVKEHFVFWQQYKESDEAQRYMTFYTITDWPYVSIIDPRTGENMVTWSKIEAATFPELITEFLTLHPTLESPAKEPPRKKMRSENILEMDEDAQMAAAIKASLAETLTNHEDSENDDTDLETFTDEDSNTNTSFEMKRKVRNDSVTQNGNSSTDPNHLNGIGGEKEKSSSNGRLPCPEDSDSWESFLGESEEKSTILIRWPDGGRDPWCQPSDSQLRSLLLFISSKGFSPGCYEVVTNFPRKQVDSLQSDLSLKECGLFPRETVFVQLKDN